MSDSLDGATLSSVNPRLMPLSPFVRFRPAAPTPLVLTCEHASARLPPTAAPRDGALRALLGTHWASDLGGWDLTRDVARRLEAPAVGARWSRLWIDLNRGVDEPDLVRATVDGVPLPWNRGLSPARRARRVAADYAPYHHAIDTLLLQQLARGRRPVVVAMHTFTPVYEGRERGFDLGVLFDRHVGPARRLSAGLRRAGFRVRANEPYSGKAGLMYSAEHHGAAHGLVCLEIEANQALLTSARQVARVGGAIAAALEQAATAAMGSASLESR
ncbi:MAG: N-formylglutamate amidohydrolase [Planctomycetota bacterium]